MLVRSCQMTSYSTKKIPLFARDLGGGGSTGQVISLFYSVNRLVGSRGGGRSGSRFSFPLPAAQLVALRCTRPHCDSGSSELAQHPCIVDSHYSIWAGKKETTTLKRQECQQGFWLRNSNSAGLERRQKSAVFITSSPPGQLSCSWLPA